MSNEIYDSLSAKAQIIWARVEDGACDITALNTLKTKNVITADEYAAIKTEFNL